MKLEGIKVGFALTGSYCTFDKVICEIQNIISEGGTVLPIMSEAAWGEDTRFGKAEDFIEKIQNISRHKIISSILEAEPLGPKNLVDIVVVAPCTGNTLSKLANAITDGPVLMACKSHLRNLKPLVISVSTNDGLGANAKNIGLLLNMKNIYFVPFGQDNPEGKPNSLVARMDLIIPTIVEALKGKQIQPILV